MIDIVESVCHPGRFFAITSYGYITTDGAVYTYSRGQCVYHKNEVEAYLAARKYEQDQKQTAVGQGCSTTVGT